MIVGLWPECYFGSLISNVLVLWSCQKLRLYSENMCLHRHHPHVFFVPVPSVALQWFCSMNAALWTASHYYPSWTNTFFSLFRFSQLLSLYRIWRQIFETFWRKTRCFDWVVYNDRQVWIQAIASFFNLFDAKGSSADLGGTVDQGSNIAWSKKGSEEIFPFKYHPNLCKQKAQMTVCFNFRREFA